LNVVDGVFQKYRESDSGTADLLAACRQDDRCSDVSHFIIIIVLYCLSQFNHFDAESELVLSVAVTTRQIFYPLVRDGIMRRVYASRVIKRFVKLNPENV